MDYGVPQYDTQEIAASAGANISLTTARTHRKWLHYVQLNWTGGTPPSSSENVVVTIDHSEGANFDIDLNTVDPATESVAKVTLDFSDEPFALGKNDQVKVTYANTDDLAISAIICTSVR